MLGEHEPIARDFMKHYRTKLLHVIDFDYDSFGQFGAKGWPAYVLANGKGEVVAQTVGLGGSGGDFGKFRVLRGIRG